MSAHKPRLNQKNGKGRRRVKPGWLLLHKATFVCEHVCWVWVCNMLQCPALVKQAWYYLLGGKIDYREHLSNIHQSFTLLQNIGNLFIIYWLIPKSIFLQCCWVSGLMTWVWCGLEAVPQTSSHSQNLLTLDSRTFAAPLNISEAWSDKQESQCTNRNTKY